MFQITLFPKGFEEGPLVHVASAVTAAIITDVFVNPLWMIKTRLQVCWLSYLISDTTNQTRLRKIQINIARV